MTNKEMLQATDPRSLTYSMTYVYDQFSWDHCEEDFEGLFATMREDTLNGKSRAPHPDQKDTKDAKKRHLVQASAF